MRCRTVLTRVDAMRTGELEAHETRMVKDHLSTCPSCDDSAADVGSLTRAIKAIAVAPPRSCRETLPLADSFDRIGEAWVAFSTRGLRMIQHGGSEQSFRDAYTRRYGRALEQTSIPAPLRDEVSGAIHGGTGGRGGIARRTPLDIEPGDLEQKVMETMVKIPRGEVRTYSWLAGQVGKPKAVRAVASFVARNVVPFIVPCHRVVPLGGGVGKYAYGSAMKRELLKREGVDVDQLDALARDGIRWIGSRTTNIVCFPTCRDARRIREENRVPFHDAAEALQKGFRPCRHCQPFAA